MKKATSAALALLFCTFATYAQNTPEDIWGTPTAENRPFVRWWWHGSAVDEIGLTWNLEQFAEAGLGGVEITPIYGVKNNEKNDIRYLSDEWMKMYAHATVEAERLGLQIDMNNGTGWPFGGPDITTDNSARKLFTEKFDVKEGETIERRLFVNEKRQKNTAVPEHVIAVGSKGRKDITSNVEGNVLKWTAEEDCSIYVLYSGHTYQKVKRAAPGGEGLVMDHYSSTALTHYLDRFEKAFSASRAVWPDTFFNDSFEVYGSDWATGLTERFAEDHGYRLELHVPEFLGEGDPDTHARIVTDYRETLACLLKENFTIPWTEWAHSHGVRTRNQAHGSPANIIDLYAAVDIPECESFGRSEFYIPGLRQDSLFKSNDGDPAVLKFASSAAHLTGKKHTSAEALTWLTEHFRTSLSQCKPEVDQMFASGVNHLYFHGAPYSPSDAAFPGWKFYASINLSPTNNIWKHAPAFFEYVTRCQTFLSSGTPDNELLLYIPLYDIWHRIQDNRFLIFDIHKMDRTMPEVKEAMNTIVENGYDADYISDELILGLSYRKGRIQSKDGAEYKAIIVPSCSMMPLKTIKKLASLARKGAKITFIGHLPEDVPGWGRLEEHRSQMTKHIKTLQRHGLIMKDLASLLPLTGATHEPFKSQENGTMQRRRNQHGGYDYFIAMLHGKGCDGWVELGTEASCGILMDPLTGKEGMAQIRKNRSGKTEVRLQISPGESLLLKTFPEDCPVDGIGIWKYTEAYGETITLDKGWSISFPESDPEIAETFFTDTLTQWCLLPDERASKNCGTARYTTTFNFCRSDGFDDYILDLGDVRESAKVTINGKDAGTFFCVPFTAEIGDYLIEGENVIEIEVCNLPSNRIADFERRGVQWRIFKDANISSVTGAKTFTFADWRTDPSGLNSTVTITPVKTR